MKVCLEGPLARQGTSPAQYFLYDKWDYYIINLVTGEAKELESALKGGIPREMNDLAVLKIKRKLLKQLSSDLTVAWSTISSELDLVPAETFISDPKTSSSAKASKEGMRFRRVGRGGVEMVRGSDSFEMGGKGHIIDIFSYREGEKQFYKYSLDYEAEHPRLALEYKPMPKREKGRSIDVYKESNQDNSGLLDLPHSA